jgi:succinyl-CoA synthetase alpha subunit
MDPLRDPASLTRLLAPRSIAVVGVSAEATGFGARTVQNMAGFDGPVWCVNPKYAGQELHGRPCYASVAELPGAPDSAVIALPRTGVAAAVEALAAKGAGGAVLYASGYGETDLPERAAEEEALRLRARALGLPLVGANCLGFVDHVRRAGATFMPDYFKMTAPAGGVGIVSQSGAMGYALMQAAERGFAVCHMATAGNSTDLDVCDLAAFQLAMPECRSVALAVEGLRDARRLLALGELARAAGKPVIVLKLGRGEIGAQAAMSHTGSLAGSTAAWSAASSAPACWRSRISTPCWKRRASSQGAAAARAGHRHRHAFGGAGIMAPTTRSSRGSTCRSRARTPRRCCAPRSRIRQPAQPVRRDGAGGDEPQLFEDCMGAMLADDQYATVIFPIVYHNPATTPRAHAHARPDGGQGGQADLHHVDSREPGGAGTAGRRRGAAPRAVPLDAADDAHAAALARPPRGASRGAGGGGAGPCPAARRDGADGGGGEGAVPRRRAAGRRGAPCGGGGRRGARGRGDRLSGRA